MFGDRAIPLAENCKISLLFLQYFYKGKISIPEDYSFVDGLDSSSISFWTYLSNKEHGEAEQLLELVLKHGSSESKYLAHVLREETSDFAPSFCQMDVYPAILIHLFFSGIFSAHVKGSYESMLGRVLRSEYYTACAFIDCQQYALANRCMVEKGWWLGSEALISKLYCLNDERLNPLMKKCLQSFWYGPQLFKRLIKRNTKDSYIPFIWNLVREAPCNRSLYLYFFIPFPWLVCILSKQKVSIADIRKVFDGPDEFCLLWKGKVSKAVHDLYSAMYWEAPERVLEYFLSLVPDSHVLDYSTTKNVLESGKYSIKFCTTLIGYCGKESALVQNNWFRFIAF